MADIFVCYRRADARGDAGRLADSLDEHFERSQIFRDVESLEGGTNYKTAIDQAIAHCTALLAVIGPRWLSVSGADGSRRLDDPDDFITLEIGAALANGVTVIPVLVGGARMPSEDELPARLKPLAAHQAVEISDSRWEYDVARLVRRLESLPGLRRPLRGLWRRVLPGPAWVKVPLALMAVILALALVTQALTGGADPMPPTGLQLIDVDLAHTPWADPTCLHPPDCNTRRAREISSLVRLRGADARYDATARELHLVLTVVWVLREGETNVFHRGYTGKLYYTTAAQHAQDGRTLIGEFTLREHSLRPFNGLIAYTLGWLEIPFLLGRDTSITTEVRRRLDASPAVAGLAR